MRLLLTKKQIEIGCLNDRQKSEKASFMDAFSFSQYPQNRAFFNVREKIRTPDLLVRSQTLYPAELHALIQYSVTYYVLTFRSVVSALFI